MKPQKILTRTHLSSCLFLLPLIAACATAPRPTIELSEIVDEQIVAMQQSHEGFVRLYYDELRQNVETFVNETWTPRFLARTLSGESEASARLRDDLDAAYLVMTVDPKAVTIEMDPGAIPDARTRDALRAAMEQAVEDQRSALGNVMLEYARATRVQIDAQRRTMRQPIDAQEALVLSELRAGYADILRANAAVKAQLASIADLVSERDVVLRRLGLLDRQRQLVDAAVAANDRTVQLLADANAAEDVVAQFQVQMEQTLARLAEIRDRWAAEAGASDDGSNSAD